MQCWKNEVKIQHYILVIKITKKCYFVRGKDRTLSAGPLLVRLHGAALVYGSIMDVPYGSSGRLSDKVVVRYPVLIRKEEVLASHETRENLTEI